jgi:hypothetical protein
VHAVHSVIFPSGRSAANHDCSSMYLSAANIGAGALVLLVALYVA